MCNSQRDELEWMPVDQRAAPFLEGLRATIEANASPFSTPGHKRGVGAPADLSSMLHDALVADMPHAGGVDTTHVSLGLLAQAEDLAAAAYGGDFARFLVNGSTTGNLAMLLAICREGEPVIVSRMLHKSLLAGLIFSGASPVYVEPVIDPERNLPLDVSAADVEAALDRWPTARAVVLVSPSYVGVSSDLARIAQACHQASVPLLVDEAWGPHFHFHPELPPSAMQSSADVAVSSTHKMLSALTQGSLIVARSAQVDLSRLGVAVNMVQTTSPSALIFASLDASRRQMALEGHRLLTRVLELAYQVRHDLGEIEGLAVIAPQVQHVPGIPAFDPARIIVDVNLLGLTGYEAEEYLRREHGVYVEMSDLLSVMLLITIGDTPASVSRLLEAFRGLVALRRSKRHEVRARSSGAVLFGGEQVMTPREAYFSATTSVPLREAVGRICAESITPYPPGIPVLVPGERIGASVLDYLRMGIGEGMYVSGPADTSFETIRVVRCSPHHYQKSTA